ncbi:polysaccharide pyruvyl transferase CsaB [Halobacillus yeomjeoni]|uniref:Polysaccharide pyruvyl transferase CsaB n=1 Tax=Halobacillus yeomjeoni TaxID=311194 RepID=A0A931MVL1_9BACI|nr:polysaccharide pyruvyl transferase CsaB [Halobacillus yeomjeoni]MBH0230715.1 polysaccharide pyruvyl transferase CsaB [Halobacillus yeomjeoni]
MHVVLSGYFGFHNAGDEAILKAMVDQIRQVDPSVKITVLSNDIVHTAQTYSVGAVDRWNLAAVTRVLRRADGLISGGGSLLQDATGPKSIIYYTGVMNLARFLRVPVYVFAQGMGPIHYRLGRTLVKYTLNRVSHLTVRDSDSEELLKRIGVRKRIELVPDPVLGMNVPEEPSEWLERQDLPKPFVTISLRDWRRRETYSPKVAEAADRLIKEGYSILLVPMHGSEDYAFSRKIAHSMKGRAWIMPADSSIEEKISVIHQSEFMIGMRLHSLIFAAISGTPFIPLSYDPKIDSFSRLYDADEVYHVENDDWTAQDLYQKSLEIQRNKSSIQQKFAELNERYRTKIKEAIAHVLNSFK